MKTFKKILIGLTISQAIVVSVFAQNTNAPTPTAPTASTQIPIVISNPAKAAGNNLIDVLNTILSKIVMPIAAVVVVMFIIWAGFSFVTAQGNPKKVEEAKQRLLWALIGAGILLGATAISGVVSKTISDFLT